MRTKCGWGFDLKPSCGMYLLGYKLSNNPVLRKAINDGVIPPYCYSFKEDDLDFVYLDNCLRCHINNGVSIEEYENKNRQIGVTRENYKMVNELAKFVMPDVRKRIEAESKALAQEMIKENRPIEVHLSNLHDC